MKKKVIIIGGGFGGIAVACRLAALGHDVELFEKRDKLGGRAFVYEINGFMFDGGPTITTALVLFDDIFKAAGRNREDYIKFIPLDPSYRIINNDGKFFDRSNNHGFTISQIERFSPSDRDGYQRLIASSRPAYEREFTELAGKPFLHIDDIFRATPGLFYLQGHKNQYKFTSGFIQNSFLRQVFSSSPLPVAGSPDEINTIHPIFQHLEHEWGLFHPSGGTGAILLGLEHLFVELGGKIHLNSEVVEILTEHRKVTGVRLLDGSVQRGDIFVSNADPAHTYQNLFTKTTRRVNTDKKYRDYHYSESLFVIYFGTRKQYRDRKLIHHNVILDPIYKGLRQDFQIKLMAKGSPLYLHMPTMTDPSLAPADCESFQVISPVPNLASGIDWEKYARPYRDAILRYLEENHLPDLRANIIAEHYIDPVHFQDTLNSPMGAAFSIQPDVRQSTWFRPHNRSQDFSNLFLVGAGTHPGPGVPGVLFSSLIASNLIQELK